MTKLFKDTGRVVSLLNETTIVFIEATFWEFFFFELWQWLVIRDGGMLAGVSEEHNDMRQHYLATIKSITSVINNLCLSFNIL